MGGGERGKGIGEGREEGRLRWLWGMDAPVCICSRFRDNGPQTYWGHDLDFSSSRDVIRSRDDSIPHIKFPIGAPLELSPYLQAFRRYLPPNMSGSRP